MYSFWNKEQNILAALNDSSRGRKLINYLQKQKYRVKALNIVYLEGVTYNTLKVNPNTLDYWNDTRLIIRDSGEIVHCAEATTEPGYYYTVRPMNSKGAARIKLGQHLDVWKIGKHKNREDALVQVAPITVHRDRNKDGSRVGDALDTGLFGINQHTTGFFRGWLPGRIGRWSAGCLVGRDPRQHKRFMDWCRWSGMKTFDTTVLSGSQLFAEGVI